MRSLIAVLGVVAVLTASAMAGITGTPVSAELANTTSAAGSYVTTANDYDDLWTYPYSAFGAVGEYDGAAWLAYDGRGTEDCPEITTTAVVPIGIYNVYVQYLAFDSNTTLGILAGLPNGAAPTGYSSNNGTYVQDVSGPRKLYEAQLGQQSGRSVSVNVDGHSWYTDGHLYEGISYEYVGAVPTSATVSADLTNTTGADPFVTTANDYDNLWTYPLTSFGAVGEYDGGCWAAYDGRGTENCPVITTSVEVPDGLYDVYVRYIAFDSNTELGILAALSGDTLAGYSSHNGTLIQEVAGARKLYEVHLGQVNGGTISVDVDGTTAFPDLAMYEGIRYALVPEPATLSLLAIGGLAALIRRRR